MTGIRIGETTYDLVESVSGATLGDLKYLGRETVSKDYPKVTVKSMQETFIRMGELVQAEGASALDLLGDDAFLANIIGVVFLARRKAGENVTYDDAACVSFNDIAFVDDEDEAEAPKDEAAEPAAP